MTERAAIDAALEGAVDAAAAKRAWDQFLSATISTHFLECELRSYELIAVDEDGAGSGVGGDGGGGDVGGGGVGSGGRGRRLVLNRTGDGRAVGAATNGGRGNTTSRAILMEGVKNFASKPKSKL